MGIDHEYENVIEVYGEVMKYDWYLPEYNIYIEYWGYFGKTYMKRKKEKIHLYRKGKLKLISIEDVMFRDIHLNLQKQLTKITKKNKIFNDIRHCPNCGLLLDERFKNKRLKSRV
jgi:predicted nuclease of restriction endonuclease-like RecB superfamily